MKTFINSLLIITFLLAPIQVYRAQALSCIQTFPRIGTLEEIREAPDQGKELGFKWVYTFKPSRVNSGEGVLIDIDGYQEIVREYIENELELFEEAAATLPAENSWDYNSLSLPSEATELIFFEPGDIIIQGPPFHVCDYRFIGIFNAEGQLKYVYVNDDYNSYKYKDILMSFEAGRPISCKGYGCQVRVNLSIGEESFTLSPGQDQLIENSLLRRINLFEASAPEEGIDANRFFPWGGGELIRYLLTFADSGEIGELASSSVELTPELDSEGEVLEETEEGGIESQEGVRESILLRFWNWLKSLFD